MQYQMTNEELIELVNEDPEASRVSIELSIRLQFAMDELDRLARREEGRNGDHT